MADVTVVYGSTGFEKISGEVRSVETQLATVGSKGLQAFRQAGSGAAEFIGHMTRLTAIVGTVQAAIGGLGGYELTKFTGSIMRATQANRDLEASLFGVLRSQPAVKTVLDFAEKYSEKSIATAHDVKETLASLAYLPAIKPILEAGDVGNMERVMNIITGLARMRPQEGMEGAGRAFSQALSGQWMGLQRQWGIRPEMVAAQSGQSVQEMNMSYENIVKGLQSFVSGSVTGSGIGFDAMMRKMKDSYQDFLQAIGQTGLYDKAIGYMGKLNESFKGFMSSDQGKGLSKGIGSVLESILDAGKRIVTKGIEWDKITDTEGAKKAFFKVGGNLVDFIKEGWDANRGTIVGALQDGLSFSIKTAASAVIPTAKAAGEGIAASLNEGMKTHPLITMGEGAAGGAWLGKKMGLPLWMGALGGAEVAAFPTQMKTLGGVWDKYQKWFADNTAAGFGLGQPGPTTVTEAWGKITPAMRLGPPAEAKKEFAPYEAGPWSPRHQPPFVMSPEQKLGGIGLWAKMAGELANAPMYTGPYGFLTEQQPGYKEAREKWNSGEMSTEEWKKVYRPMHEQERVGYKTDLFQGEYEKKLTGLVGEAGTPGDVKQKAYQELFGIAMQRGETDKAGDYMQKALDSFIQAAKEASGQKEAIKANTTALVQNTDALMKKLDKESQPKAPEPGTQNPSPSLTPASGPSNDEFEEMVKQNKQYF